jgi:hypothetical protein
MRARLIFTEPLFTQECLNHAAELRKIYRAAQATKPDCALTLLLLGERLGTRTLLTSEHSRAFDCHERVPRSQSLVLPGSVASGGLNKFEEMLTDLMCADSCADVAPPARVAANPRGGRWDRQFIELLQGIRSLIEEEGKAVAEAALARLPYGPDVVDLSALRKQETQIGS